MDSFVPFRVIFRDYQFRKFSIPVCPSIFRSRFRNLSPHQYAEIPTDIFLNFSWIWIYELSLWEIVQRKAIFICTESRIVSGLTLFYSRGNMLQLTKLLDGINQSPRYNESCVDFELSRICEQSCFRSYDECVQPCSNQGNSLQRNNIQ